MRANYLTLYHSYLSNQTQIVEINGEKSTPSLITCGVPQGSILGSILFLIYINDLNQCSEHPKFIHFADDSTLYAIGKTLSCLTSKMNQELQKVVRLRINKLVTIQPFHILRRLLFTLIYPFVTSGIEIWGHSPSAQLKVLSNKIDKSLKLQCNVRVLSFKYQKLNSLPLA